MKFNEIGIKKYIDLDKWGLSSFSLKMIAVITMLIDHCAVFFVHDNRLLYLAMRSIGRLSFPLYCFLLVEGYFHTRNKLKHCINLIVFAILSEVPYDLTRGVLFSMDKQNVIFTLLIGFVVIWALDWVHLEDKNSTGRNLELNIMNGIISLIVSVVGLGLAYILNSTYSYTGVFLIIAFYAFHNKRIGRIIGNAFFNIGLYSPGVQWMGVFSAVIIELYNGKPGARKWKYFFYLFYPVHLLVLVALERLI